MPIKTAKYGTIQENAVSEYTLDNGNDMVVKILDYGGIISQLHVPGKYDVADVVLGFDSLDGYLNDIAFVGAIIGRFANRISHGRFKLNNVTYQLDINEPPNHIHGGLMGFHRQYWQSEAYTENGDLCLRLNRTSIDMECGYPGNLDVTVLYRLTTENLLHFEITASADKATPVSLTQHSYFNLRGHNSGDICEHELSVNADTITPVGPDLIPTGEIRDVTDTPYDLRERQQLGPRQRAVGNGFDINYVLNKNSDSLTEAAVLTDPVSLRRMKIFTTKPAIQFYDGTHLGIRPMLGKGGTEYSQCAGLCLESQHFPDAVNHPDFPSAVVQPGEQYNHKTIYAFDIDS